MKLRNVVVFCVFSLISCTTSEKQDITNVEVQPPQFKFASSCPVVINEICPNNGGNLRDESGEDHDWIELYNKSDTALNLKGFGLTDDPNDPFKWKFGAVTIQPHQYMIVFASGKDINTINTIALPDTLTFSGVYGWSDSLVGGKSSIRTHEFSDIVGIANGTRVISAVINLVDGHPSLDWSSANITVEPKRTFTSLGTDYSMYNALELTATFEKDREVVIRFLQGSDIESWLSPCVTIKGTGKKNDTYVISLVTGVNGVNLKNFTGFSIEAPKYVFRPITFDMSQARFLHTGHSYHTNFKLSDSDSLIILTNTDTLTLDTVRLSVLPPDISMGKSKFGWKIMTTVTPGAVNDTTLYSSIGIIPQCVTRGGFYDAPVTVELKPVDNGVIYYTLDGSVPDISKTKYTTPIRIDSSTVLRYTGVSSGSLVSEIRTETFFINVQTKLPVISIAVEPGAYFDPDTGIYVGGKEMYPDYPYFMGNFWKDIDVPATVQFFENDKSLKFTENVGTTIMGNWSRAEPKKSLGVKFNEKYGKSELNYPLFPKYPATTKFKKFVLRNNGNNFGYGYFNDPLMQSLIDVRGVDFQEYRPVVVYINGEYFGIHQLMEAANENIVLTHHGLDKNQIDFYDVGAIIQGTTAHWNSVLNLLDKQPKGSFSDSAYSKVKELVDVNNYIDYMALEMFINNMDWPANNMRWWRSRDNGKWRWIVYDTDFSFGDWAPDLSSHNAFEYVLGDPNRTTDYPNGGTWVYLLGSLMNNQTFREDFANRYATLLATNFTPENIINKIDTMYNEILSEIPKDSVRWNLEKYGASINETERLKTFGSQRGQYVLKHIQDYFKAPGTYSLSIQSVNGTVTINDMSIPGNYTGTYFTTIPV
ncbi:MAG TPA: CotH kinase family protein, partial [Chitinispirillaceae bacterium]|nr:CotH kinase family protein [Chitinispirillaceae bacterium]